MNNQDSEERETNQMSSDERHAPAVAGGVRFRTVKGGGGGAGQGGGGGCRRRTQDRAAARAGPLGLVGRARVELSQAPTLGKLIWRVLATHCERRHTRRHTRTQIT